MLCESSNIMDVPYYRGCQYKDTIKKHVNKFHGKNSYVLFFNNMKDFESMILPLFFSFFFKTFHL